MLRGRQEGGRGDGGSGGLQVKVENTVRRSRFHVSFALILPPNASWPSVPSGAWSSLGTVSDL